MSNLNQTKTDDKSPDVMPDPDDDIEVATTAVVDQGDQVEQAEPVDDLPPLVKNKADRLAEAARLYREKRDAEEAEFSGDAPAPVTEEVANPDPVEAAAAGKAEMAAPVFSDDTEIELNIYGQQVKKTFKEVKAEAQKALAADQKLEEAKRLVAEVKALKESLTSRQTADDPVDQLDDEPARRGSARKPDKSQLADQPDDDVDQEALDSIVERIQVGDKDEGRAAIADLVKLMNNGNTSRLDETKVRDIIRQDNVQTETKREIDTALARFSEQFPSITSDDDLVDVALRRVANEMRADLKANGMSDDDVAKIADNRNLAHLHGEVRRKGAKVRSYDALLTDVGTYLANKFGKPEGKPATTPTQTQPARTAAPQPPKAQQRVEMKRAAAQQPRAAGARSPVQSAPKPKTTAEIIAEMRRSRPTRFNG